MTNKQRLLAALKGEKVDRLPWVADLAWWHSVNKKNGTLPEEYEDMNLLELHRAVGAIISSGVFNFYKAKSEENVKVSSEVEGDDIITRISTPVGRVQARSTKTSVSESYFQKEFMIKRAEDCKVMEYILDHTIIEPDLDSVTKLQEYYGEDGLSVPCLPRSPLQKFLIELAGYENGFLAFYDYREELESLMSAMERADDEIYRIAGECPSDLIAFGENIDCDITNPRLFKSYNIPYYKKRTDELHKKGKLCLCHMDGKLKTLLPLIKCTGFDVIEGIAPQPMGDITIVELKEALEGKVMIWGGIPASILCPGFSDEYVKEFTLDILRTVAPEGGFILGIGDMLPVNGYIHRVKLISDIVKDYGIYAAELS